MESTSVCNHTRDQQKRTTAKQESDLSITSVIIDTIGLHKVLYQFIITVTISEDNKPIEDISPVETISKVKNVSILEIPQFFLVLVVVAMVVVINSVIGGFGGKDSV